TRLKASPRLPTTSQPSVGAFEEVFRPLREAGDEVLSVHLSAKLSGTFGAARMAADAVDPEHITVVDSGTVAMAMGFLVLEAARPRPTHSNCVSGWPAAIRSSPFRWPKSGR